MLNTRCPQRTSSTWTSTTQRAFRLLETLPPPAVMMGFRYGVEGGRVGCWGAGALLWGVSVNSSRPPRPPPPLASSSTNPATGPWTTSITERYLRYGYVTAPGLPPQGFGQRRETNGWGPWCWAGVRHRAHREAGPDHKRPCLWPENRQQHSRDRAPG